MVHCVLIVVFVVVILFYIDYYNKELACYMQMYKVN